MMTLFIITIIAFLGVTVLNIFTYVGVDLSSVFPLINLSLIAVLIMSGILFFKTLKRLGRFRKQVDLSVPYNNLSNPFKWFINIGGFYAFACILMNIYIVRGGGTGIHEGQYAILDKGMFVRFISEEAYHRYNLIELRTVTAMFMFMGIITIVGYYHSISSTTSPS